MSTSLVLVLHEVSRCSTPTTATMRATSTTKGAARVVTSMVVVVRLGTAKAFSCLMTLATRGTSTHATTRAAVLRWVWQLMSLAANVQVLHALTELSVHRVEATAATPTMTSMWATSTTPTAAAVGMRGAS
jgi:hypothetical protein